MAGILWEIGSKELLGGLEDINPINSVVKGSADAVNDAISKGLHKIPLVGDAMDGVNSVVDKGTNVLKSGMDKIGKETGITDLKEHITNEINTHTDKIGDKLRDKLGIPKDEPDLSKASTEKLEKGGWRDTEAQKNLRDEILSRKIALQNISDHFNALKKSGRFLKPGGEEIQDQLIQDFKDIESGKKKLESKFSNRPLHEVEYTHDQEFVKGVKPDTTSIMESIQKNIDAGKTQVVDPIDKAHIRIKLKRFINNSENVNDVNKEKLIEMLDNDDVDKKNMFNMRDDGSIYVNEELGNTEVEDRANELTKIIIDNRRKIDPRLKKLLLGPDGYIKSTTDSTVTGTPFIINENKEFDEMRKLIKDDISNKDFSDKTRDIDAEGRINEFRSRHDKELWDKPQPQDEEQAIIDQLNQEILGDDQTPNIVLQKGGDPSTPEVTIGKGKGPGTTTTTDVRKRMRRGDKGKGPEKASPSLTNDIEIPNEIAKKLSDEGKEQLQSNLNLIDSKLGREHVDDYLKHEFKRNGSVNRVKDFNEANAGPSGKTIRKNNLISRQLINKTMETEKRALKNLNNAEVISIGDKGDIGDIGGNDDIEVGEELPDEETVDISKNKGRNIPEDVIVNENASIGSVLSNDEDLKIKFKDVPLSDILTDENDLMDFNDADKVWKDKGIEEKTGVSLTRKLWNGIKNNMISAGTAKNIAFGATDIGGKILDLAGGGKGKLAGGFLIAGGVGSLLGYNYATVDKTIQDNPLLSDETKAISTEIKNTIDSKLAELKDGAKKQILDGLKNIGKTEKQIEQSVKERDEALKMVNFPPNGSSSSVKAGDRRNLRDAENNIMGGKASMRAQLQRTQKDIRAGIREVEKKELLKKEIDKAKKEKNKQKEKALKDGIVSPKMTPFNINFSVDNQSDSSVNKKFTPINNKITGKKNKLVSKHLI